MIFEHALLFWIYLPEMKDRGIHSSFNSALTQYEKKLNVNKKRHWTNILFSLFLLIFLPGYLSGADLQKNHLEAPGNEPIAARGCLFVGVTHQFFFSIYKSESKREVSLEKITKEGVETIASQIIWGGKNSVELKVISKSRANHLYFGSAEQINGLANNIALFVRGKFMGINRNHRRNAQAL